MIGIVFVTQNSVHIVGATTGQRIDGKCIKHDGVIRSICMGRTNEGKNVLVTGGADKMVKMWKPCRGIQGEQKFNAIGLDGFKHHKDWVTCVCLGQDEKKYITDSELDQELKREHANTYTDAKLADMSLSDKRAALGKDTILVSGSADRTLQIHRSIHNTRTRKLQSLDCQSLNCHSNWVVAVCMGELKGDNVHVLSDFQARARTHEKAACLL